ncbi:SigE family RNA polymerase sigma factor [Streptomyces sp. NBC_00233]|uniref:SigE family RNA polymerase sigma factor n=1 Tax=Streptomyces sp. NBC_00233 TaxID=2975686 RepID=UPI00225417D2|nr:SigE family RNA polymerase sigma factor [Streptomyces sp. NBC_00233]MCX5233098.1 SigE family RNA polymerase sigma factor [Streptomyces sp. NBC_00233]
MTHKSRGEFAEFAAVSWPRLVRTAHMLTGDFHEAENLVQTTLVKVHARWGRIPCDEVNVYVRRALVNNSLSRIRRKRVALLLMPFLRETVHRSQGGHAEDVEHCTAVAQALSPLPARQRAVMVLRYWEDMSEQDIAQILDCSLGTVQTHARRGLQALRAHPLFAPAAFSGASR